MTRLIGAAVILCASGVFGYLLASQYKNELVYLHKLQRGLNYMLCDISYHITPLSDLLREAGQIMENSAGSALITLSGFLEENRFENGSQAMSAALERHGQIPSRCKKLLQLLGQSLGEFDLDGQVTQIQLVLESSRQELDEMEQQKQVRIRNYQTLSLCAGAALVILLL